MAKAKLQQPDVTQTALGSALAAALANAPEVPVVKDTPPKPRTKAEQALIDLAIGAQASHDSLAFSVLNAVRDFFEERRVTILAAGAMLAQRDRLINHAQSVILAGGAPNTLRTYIAQAASIAICPVNGQLTQGRGDKKAVSEVSVETANTARGINACAKASGAKIGIVKRGTSGSATAIVTPVAEVTPESKAILAAQAAKATAEAEGAKADAEAEKLELARKFRAIVDDALDLKRADLHRVLIDAIDAHGFVLTLKTAPAGKHVARTIAKAKASKAAAKEVAKTTALTAAKAAAPKGERVTLSPLAK